MIGAHNLGLLFGKTSLLSTGYFWNKTGTGFATPDKSAFQQPELKSFGEDFSFS
jgi:hypothetical protein